MESKEEYKMIDKNLFGEAQEYWDEDKKEKVEAEKTKSYIKELIREQICSEVICYLDTYNFDYNQFFKEQENHLLKIWGESKGEDDFLERYYFVGVEKI